MQHSPIGRRNRIDFFLHLVALGVSAILRRFALQVDRGLEQWCYSIIFCDLDENSEPRDQQQSMNSVEYESSSMVRTIGVNIFMNISALMDCPGREKSFVFIIVQRSQ